MAIASTGLLQGQTSSADLFLAPDIQAYKLGSASLQDERLGTAAPVANDAKAVLGWQTAAFNGPVMGFISDAKIGKDLLPVDGTPIHATPNGNSPVLGTYRTGDPIKVLDTGVWWKVNVVAAFPVYFIADTLPPESLPPVAGGEQVEIYSSAIEDDSVIFDETVVEAAQEEPVAVTIPDSSREPRIGIVSRSYTGNLVRAKKGIGPFRPKAPFELLNNKGKRLVWVDFTEVIMPGTIRGFLGRDVHIRGEPVQDEKSREWIVYVRTIHETP